MMFIKNSNIDKTLIFFLITHLFVWTLVPTISNINLPLDTTIWKVRGNKLLSPNNPITLEWDNNDGLTFVKKIKQWY